jgi:cadmium resistance transport/sequestration family protein
MLIWAGGLMSILGAVVSGTIAFASTNLDDIFVLMTLFSQRNSKFRNHHIVVGQYLGIAILTTLSIIAAYGVLLLPKVWIGLLGLIPIYFGIKMLVEQRRNKGFSSDKVEEQDIQLNKDEKNKTKKLSFLYGFLSPYSVKVASITIANGGDNIGIYVPFFATSNSTQILVIIIVFAVLVAVWCYAGYKIAQNPLVSKVIERYGHIFIPFVFIGLGVHIITFGGTLSYLYEKLFL